MRNPGGNLGRNAVTSVAFCQHLSRIRIDVAQFHHGVGRDPSSVRDFELDGLRLYSDDLRLQIGTAQT